MQIIENLLVQLAKFTLIVLIYIICLFVAAQLFGAYSQIPGIGLLTCGLATFLWIPAIWVIDKIFGHYAQQAKAKRTD